MAYNDLAKGRFSSVNQIYFITTVVNNRTKYFNNIYVARKVIKEMKYMHDEDYLHSIAWVLMPDHLHWIFQLAEKQDLPSVMGLFKGRSAKRVNEVMNLRGPFWQRAYYDHALRKGEDIKEISRYMVANPLRAGLVENIGDYPLWDAIWL